MWESQSGAEGVHSVALVLFLNSEHLFPLPLAYPLGELFVSVPESPQTSR